MSPPGGSSTFLWGKVYFNIHNNIIWLKCFGLVMLTEYNLHVHTVSFLLCDPCMVVI